MPHPSARNALLRVTQLALACALVVGTLALSSRIFVPKNNQKEFGQHDEAAFGVLGEPQDSLDVIFIGDSEAYCSFSPLQLWHEQGIASYVCATSAQRLPYTRTILKHALDRQHPSIVILETNCLFRHTSVEFAASRALQDVFPVFEYHDRWKTLRAEDFVAERQTTWTDPYSGFRLRTSVDSADANSAENYMRRGDKRANMGRVNRFYLEQLATLCHDHGAELVLVSAPSVKNWSSARHDNVNAIADELGLAYIDLNDGEKRVKIDWSRDTLDKGDHLNLRGASKVTHAVGELLKGHFGLKGHAGDVAYLAWNEDFDRYEREVKKVEWPDAK